RYIADIVFNDQHKLSLLEKILHPVVIKETIELMDASLIMNDRVFVEAALIYEADMEKYFDLVILIVANKNLRFERKRKSEKFTEEEFEKREVMQIPEEEKRKRADFIFENNSDLKSLKQKAELLFILLNKPVTSNKQ
ncbi:MAG: dephospho-CoA kinase, partial [Ignavibacteriaceae bacterium]